MKVTVRHDLVEKRGFLLHPFAVVDSQYLAKTMASRPENMFRDLRYRKVYLTNIFGIDFAWHCKPIRPKKIKIDTVVWAR